LPSACCRSLLATRHLPLTVLNCPVRSRGRQLGSLSCDGDKGVISRPHLEGRAVEPVRNILEQFIGQFASPEWLKDVLQVKWRQIVGDQLAKRTQVRQVKNGVVTIVASTPAIASDLQFHKDELRERIRQVAQFEPLDIRIRIGTVQPEPLPSRQWERQLERIVLSPRDHGAARAVALSAVGAPIGAHRPKPSRPRLIGASRCAHRRPRLAPTSPANF